MEVQQRVAGGNEPATFVAQCPAHAPLRRIIPNHFEGTRVAGKLPEVFYEHEVAVRVMVCSARYNSHRSSGETVNPRKGRLSSWTTLCVFWVEKLKN